VIWRSLGFYDGRGLSTEQVRAAKRIDG